MGQLNVDNSGTPPLYSEIMPVRATAPSMEEAQQPPPPYTVSAPSESILNRVKELKSEDLSQKQLGLMTRIWIAIGTLFSTKSLDQYVSLAALKEMAKQEPSHFDGSKLQEVKKEMKTIPTSEKDAYAMEFAKKFYLNNQPKAAMELLDMHSNQGSHAVLFLKGAILEEQGEYAQAVNAFEKAQEAGSSQEEKERSDVSRINVLMKLQGTNLSILSLSDLIALSKYDEATYAQAIETKLREIHTKVMGQEGDSTNRDFMKAFDKELKDKELENKLIGIIRSNPQAIPTGAFVLGILHKAGIHGVTQDLGKAVGYFKNASDAGVAPATRNLALSYERGDGVKKDQQTAFEHYVKASDQGSRWGAYHVGCRYIFGRGVMKAEDHGKSILMDLRARGHKKSAGKLKELGVK